MANPAGSYENASPVEHSSVVSIESRAVLPLSSL